MDIIDSKKDQFLFFEKTFGAPSLQPCNFNFNDNYAGMTEVDVIKMGKALGLLKKDKRNETYLLWIA